MKTPKSFDTSLDFNQIASNVLKDEAKSLLDSATSLPQVLPNTALKNIISLILDSTSQGGKLIIIGVGKSGHIGGKIAATLASTGTPSFFLHPTEALHGDLGMVSQNDIVLAISYSGTSSEVLAIIPHLKERAKAIITMSKAKDSALSQYSEHFLPIFVEREACPIDSAPMSSTTLTLAMGDALAACLMHARGFGKQDFGSLHPGGALGRKLFVKIADIMQKDNLPIITQDTSLKEAIIEMSQKRLGNAIIVENELKPIAILSDGDLRRAMMSKDFCLDSPALRYASKSPKTCNDENLLASQALEIIEKSKIQLLIITDKNNSLKGVLHIHALLDAGITID